jgi:hypothetical protein
MTHEGERARATASDCGQGSEVGARVVVCAADGAHAIHPRAPLVEDYPASGGDHPCRRPTSGLA